MPRPRLLSTVALAALALLAPSLPAVAAPIALQDLERLQTLAAAEGLPIKTMRLTGPKRLTIRSEETMTREAFIKRASLLAYFVFNRLPSEVEQIAFENQQATVTQTCAIRAADHASYLKDAISKAEYEKRLAYRQDGGAYAAGAAVAPPPSLPTLRPIALAPAVPPVLPNRALPVPVLPRPDLRPETPAPAARVGLTPAVTLNPLVGFGYGLGVGGGRYDAYMVEYGHPVLPTLDVRPSLQIISPFSPINFMAGPARPIDGLSVACDLLGTTRQDPSVHGLSFEGGLGARVGTWQGTANAGLWPALHMRLGMRWHALSVAMRYPLLNRGGDPTAGWDATVGVGMPLSVLIGK